MAAYTWKNAVMRSTHLAYLLNRNTHRQIHIQHALLYINIYIYIYIYVILVITFFSHESPGASMMVRPIVKKAPSPTLSPRRPAWAARTRRLWPWQR